MRNRKTVIMFIIVTLMLLITVSASGADVKDTATEVTRDVNELLAGYIRVLQWAITAVMLVITAAGILPELFSAGRPPDIAGIFMKFIQAAVIIGIAWGIGDLINAVFGANINIAMIT